MMTNYDYNSFRYKDEYLFFYYWQHGQLTTWTISPLNLEVSRGCVIFNSEKFQKVEFRNCDPLTKKKFMKKVQTKSVSE